MQKEVIIIALFLVIGIIVISFSQQQTSLTGKAIEDEMVYVDEAVLKESSPQEQETQLPFEEPLEEKVKEEKSETQQEPLPFRQPPAFELRDSFATVGATFPCQNSVVFNPQTNVYAFTCSANNNPIVRYEIDVGYEWTQKGLITIKEALSNAYLVYAGGVTYIGLDGSFIMPYNFAYSSGATIQFSHRILPNGVVRLSYIETLQGITTQKIYDYWIMGRTLGLHVYAVNSRQQARGNYNHLFLAPTENTGRAGNPPQQVVIPYMELVPIVAFNNNNVDYFMTNYVDWSKSNSNNVPANPNWAGRPSSDTSIYNFYIADYIGDVAGNKPALDDTAYITLSTDPYDVMMNIYRQKPLYRDAANSRVTFNFGSFPWTMGYTRHTSTFANLHKIIDILYSFGLRDLWISSFDDYGTIDNAGPTEYPPRIQVGGSKDLMAAARAAARYGYLLGMYEDYTDMHNVSTYWDTSAIARMPDGTLKESWLSVRGHVNYRIRPELGRFYASLNSPYFKELGLNTIYLDVQITAPFYAYLDYAASAHPDAKTTQGVIRLNKELLDYLRSVYQNPLGGESTAGSALLPTAYYVGVVETQEREISQKECGNVVPDFELKVLRPLTIGKGMGPQHRWITCRNTLGEYTDPLSMLGSAGDKFRATAIAYGRAGLFAEGVLYGEQVSCQRTGCPFLYQVLKLFLREYFLMKELQKQYLSADSVQVSYRTPAGNWVDLKQIILEALRGTVELNKTQIKEEYNNGLVVYVNRHPTSSFSVTAPNSVTYTLPPNSYIAWNPTVPGYNNYGTFLTFSAITPTSGGRRVDYINSPAYVMADGRGTYTDFGNIQTQYLKVITSEVNPPLTITESPELSFNNFQWPITAAGGMDPVFVSPVWQLQGGAIDLNFPTQYTSVKFYADGPQGLGKFILQGIANDPRWWEGHGFDFIIPQTSGLYDGKPHTIYGYTTDLDEGIDMSFPVRFINVPTTPDSAAPEVYLLAPLNDTEDRAGTVYFVAHAHDNVALKNATLYISLPSYHSNTREEEESRWTAVQTVELTPYQEASVMIAQPDLPNEAKFDWNIQVCDFANNCAFARDNNFIRLRYKTRPSVGLYRPANAEVLVSFPTTFTAFISSGAPLVGAALETFVNNQWIPILVNTTLTEKEETVRFTVPEVPDGVYIWNVRACNNLGECERAPRGYFFQMQSDPPPVVTLTNPPGGYQTTSTTVTFTATASDNRQLRDATLYTSHTGTWEARQTVPLSGTSAPVSITLNNLPQRTFEWSIESCDTVGNCAFAPERRSISIVITPPPVNPPTLTLIGPPDHWLLLMYGYLTFAGYAVAGDRPLSSATLYTSMTGQWGPLGSPISLSGNAASFSVRRQTSLSLPILWNFKVCDTSTPAVCALGPVNFTLALTQPANPSPRVTIAWPYNRFRLNKAPSTQAHIIATVRSYNSLKNITLFYEIDGEMRAVSVINNPSNPYNAIFTLPATPGNILLHYNIGACTTSNICDYASLQGSYLDIGNAPNNHPTVQITSPQNGASFGSTTTTVIASASDDIGVNRVEFYIDNTLQAVDTTPPYTYSLNTQSLALGYYLITAKAYDASEQFTAYQIMIRRT